MQAPGNAVCMWSVPTQLRPFAMSMSVVAIHVLGDVPSPPLMGLMQGRLQNWRLRWAGGWRLRSGEAVCARQASKQGLPARHGGRTAAPCLRQGGAADRRRGLLGRQWRLSTLHRQKASTRLRRLLPSLPPSILARPRA